MKRGRIALLAILCAKAGAVWVIRDTAGAAPPEAGASLPIRFQAELDRLREANALPALTAAYQLKDGTSQAFASGLADRELGLPATVETRMLSGSTGKTIVAALAVTLAQEGNSRSTIRSRSGSAASRGSRGVHEMRQALARIVLSR